VKIPRGRGGKTGDDRGHVRSIGMFNGNIASGAGSSTFEVTTQAR
jgi:hypothetical protein